MPAAITNSLTDMSTKQHQALYSSTGSELTLLTAANQFTHNSCQYRTPIQPAYQVLPNEPGEASRQCLDRPKLTVSNLLLSIITFFCFTIICVFPLKARPLSFISEPTIRVCLSDNNKDFVIKVNGTYKVIYDSIIITRISNTSFKCSPGKNLRPILYLPYQKIEFTSPIKFVPVTDSLSSAPPDVQENFNFDGQTYPGEFELIPTRENIVLIINMVGLETYLRGVVPNELVNNPTDDELQACMAQAVAARNYAIYKIAEADSQQFDVYSDTRDQVYSGIEGYRPLADSAVKMTAGIIVEYNGAPARCFFHSTCGGQTERVQNVWQGQPALPYLQGISDIDSTTGAPFCVDSPRFYWTQSFSSDILDNLITKYLAIANPGYTTRTLVGRITNISIIDRFSSFRVDSLQITTLDGKKYFVRSDRIRYLFRQPDGGILRSTLFRIEIKRNKYGDIQELTLRGQGNGHGVGMCQWGAIGMSRKGYDYKQILSHYYPGTTIKKIY